MLIIWQNTAAGRPDAAFCRAMQRETGLANVVFDADGVLDAAGMGLTHQHYVLEEGSRVVHYRVGDNSTFAGFVDDLLGR